jgi:hypothetical protein
MFCLLFPLSIGKTEFVGSGSDWIYLRQKRVKNRVVCGIPIRKYREAGRWKQDIHM